MKEVLKMNENIIKNRSELLFLYDVEDGNPNGDPADENKPRIDDDTNINIVTDVRLKRTVRDYLMQKGFEIFVREISNDKGEIQDAKARARNFLTTTGGSLEVQMGEIKNTILEKCIDVRLFGGTIPVELKIKKMKKEENTDNDTEEESKKKSSITLTGPVQFKMGRSLNKVKLQYIKGTGAFASDIGKEQKTFREEWILYYSLICFYGIVNENAAKETKLTEEDVNHLLDGMWNGTKNLISRSKMAHNPRILLKINYKEKNYHIGDIDKLVKYSSDLADEEVRDISNLRIDLTKLIETLEKNKDKIESLDWKVDDRVKTFINGSERKLSDILTEAHLNNKELSL